MWSLQELTLPLGKNDSAIIVTLMTDRVFLLLSNFHLESCAFVHC